MATTTPERRAAPQSSGLGMRNRRNLQLVINYTIMVLVALIILLPLVWMLSTSFKPKSQWFAREIEWIPRTFTLENYNKIFNNRTTPIGRWFLNSIILGVITTALTLVIDSLAAYAYARLRFPGRKVIFAMLLATLFLPGVMFLVPNFITIFRLRLLNTFPGVFLPALAGVFGVFFLRQFFETIPITFLASWNDFLWPLLILQDRALQTLPPGLRTLQGAYTSEYGQMMAGAAIAAVPVLLIYIFAPRPSSAQPTAAPTAAATGPDQFSNPVLRADFADPHVLRVGDSYYAYATNAPGGKNVQAARSQDLVRWEQLPDAMPELGAWAQLGGSYVWAPEVIQIGEQFVLYYTARDKQADRQCVGVATAAKPEGKFKDPYDKPLVCQVDEGGTIDAHPFRDADGTLYLYYKNDGNCCAKPTYLYVQELAPDGLSLVGEPARLVHNDRAWEGNVVEAPTPGPGSPRPTPG